MSFAFSSSSSGSGRVPRGRPSSRSQAAFLLPPLVFFSEGFPSGGAFGGGGAPAAGPRAASRGCPRLLARSLGSRGKPAPVGLTNGDAWGTRRSSAPWPFLPAHRRALSGAGSWQGRRFLRSPPSTCFQKCERRAA